MAVVNPFPVTLNYSYDASVVLNDKNFYTTDDFYFVLSDLLNEPVDVTANQDNLSILTGNFNLNNKIDDFVFDDKTGILTNVAVSFVSASNSVYLSAGSPGTEISITKNLSAATIFYLDFISYPGYVGLSSNGLLITITGPATGTDINLQTLRGDAGSTQYFSYALYNNTITFFTPTTNQILNVSNSTGKLQRIAYTSTNFNTRQLFKLARYDFNAPYIKGKSNIIKYVSTPNDLTIETATKNLNYNYFITTPYKTFDTTVLYANVNLTPLKNYYSPQGIQTPTLDTQIRTYNKIHTGLNTEEGNDKIYISYKGSEIAKYFAKDKDTYFHYPASATNITFKNSTLVKAGALGGSSPFRSDRLFVKKANYRNYSNWGDYSVGQQNGTLFCTWLSASPLSGKDPAWMDRYYNPAQINLTAVLTSTAFTSANNNYPNLIWDVPSSQRFEPECLYVYHRIGDTDNQLVVDALSSSLTRYIQNWANPLINEITGLSAGTLYNFATSAVEVFPGTRDECLDTTISYGVVDFTNEELYNNGITLAFYAYNTDWSNIKGSQLVGNYYDGGIGITKNNTLLTPFTTVINPLDCSLKTVNTNLNVLKTTPTGLYNKNFILKSEYEASYYIITNEGKILTYDQDDLNVDAHTFSLSGILINAQLVQNNGIKRIVVVSKSGSNVIYKLLEIDGTEVTTTIISNFNNIALTLDGTPVAYNSISGSSTVDSKNTVFALSGDILIRGLSTSTSATVLSALSAEYVACDHEDNIWVLYGGRSLGKLDNYGNILWDAYLTDAPQLSSATGASRIINFIAEINPTSGGIIHSGLVIDPRTQTLVKIDSGTGTVTKTTYVSGGLAYGIVAGDTTGYDYQRKYIYTKENSNDLSVKVFARAITGNKASEQIINLNHDVSVLTPGWHHFAVTLNPDNKLTFYIDGLVAETTQVGALSSIYRVFNNKNNPNLIVGTASFKKQTLAQYTNETTDVYRYSGKIADVRFYTQALEQADIKAISKRFLLESFTDLRWSVPTGSRYYIEQNLISLI
jgi:hypothetical protein